MVAIWILDIIYPSEITERELNKYLSPDTDVAIDTKSSRISIEIESIPAIVNDLNLVDYSFSFFVNSDYESMDYLKNYLDENNIKYVTVYSKSRSIRNPTLVKLLEQMTTEEHAIRFEIDKKGFTIYYSDKIILETQQSIMIYDRMCYLVEYENIYDSLRDLIKIKDAKTAIIIFDSDIPSLIQWLRNRYTSRGKSAKIN